MIPRAAYRFRLACIGTMLALAGSAVQWPGDAWAGEPTKAAIFPAELDDPSLPYGRKPPPAALKRLDLATEQLRASLSGSGAIRSVDLAPQAGEIDKQAPLYKCNGCTGDIASALGADLAVTTLAEKGSSQVFNLTITISDAASGKVVRRGRVVISADTDDDWRHAVRSVVKNRLLAEPLPDRS